MFVFEEATMCADSYGDGGYSEHVFGKDATGYVSIVGHLMDANLIEQLMDVVFVFAVVVIAMWLTGQRLVTLTLKWRTSMPSM